MLNCKCIADSLPVICSAWPRLTRLAMMDCKGSIGNTGSIHMVAPHNLGHLHMSKASLAVLGIHLGSYSRPERLTELGVRLLET